MVNGSQSREPTLSNFPGLSPTEPDVSPGRRLPVRLNPTFPDPLTVPAGQRVAGSNPAVLTVFRTLFESTGNEIAMIVPT